ncbi:MAG: hypothetical protein ACM3MN_00870 [Nitrospirota bacterium]
MNANREAFESVVRNFAQAELHWPGWPAKLLTHPVKGLENQEEMIQLLTNGRGVIKTYVKVAER